jgi:3-oxoacyl-[acyl-carrier protein] reductase
MGKLENKRALVTGSSSGIGAGVAAAFAKEGADVVVNYPGPKQTDAAEKVAEMVRAEGRRSEAIQADVSDPEQVARLVDGTVEALGGIDILVNNAGIAGTNNIEDMSIEEWDRMIAIHLRSVFLVTRLVLPMMYRQNSGKIVNTASQLAYKASPRTFTLRRGKGSYCRLHALSRARDRHAQYQCQLRGSRRHADAAHRRHFRRTDGQHSPVDPQGPYW